MVKHSLKVYKNEKIKELMLNEENKLTKKEELELKMSTVPIKTKTFPVEEGKTKYPVPSNYEGNPLYRTSNMGYGSTLPTNYDLPSNINIKRTFCIDRYYPRTTQFTEGFLGGMFAETGLQTAKTKSGVTKDHDGYFA